MACAGCLHRRVEVGGQRTHLRATQQRPLAAPLATMRGGERMVAGGYILIIIEQNALQTLQRGSTPPRQIHPTLTLASSCPRSAYSHVKLPAICPRSAARGTYEDGFVCVCREMGVGRGGTTSFGASAGGGEREDRP